MDLLLLNISADLPVNMCECMLAFYNLNVQTFKLKCGAMWIMFCHEVWVCPGVFIYVVNLISFTYLDIINNCDVTTCMFGQIILFFV